DVWRQWYREQGRDCPPPVGAGPRYELFTMLLAAAQAGMGVALVPGFLARQALGSGELTLADEGVLPVGEAYYFSYPAQDRPSEALLAFEAWLRAEAGLI